MTRSRRVLPLLSAAPALGALAYAIVLASRVPSLVHDTATSDSVGPMVIAQALPQRSAGSTVVMGNAAHYTTLWFDRLTAGLPGHRAIWEAFPYVLSLLGLLLLVLTVRRLAGWRAALVCGAIGLATPPLVLAPLLAQAFHSTTFVNGIVLGALLVGLGRAGRLLSPPLLVLCLVAALLTGLDVASDPLLLVVGVAPFAAAAVLVAVRRWDRHAVELLAVAASVVVVSLLAAGVTALLMRNAGYHVQGLPFAVAGGARVRDNASLLGHLVLDMGNGRLSLHGLGTLGALRIVCGVLVILGALVPPALLFRLVASSTPPATNAAGEADDGVALHLAYWGFVALFLALAFVLTTLPADSNSMRYLIPGFYAIAATVPLLTLRSTAWCVGVATAVTLVTLSGAFLLHRASLVDDFNVQPQHADGLIAELERHGLSHGYAGYWQAGLLTWQSEGKVTVRAVRQGGDCHASPGWFCPYPIFTISDWYRPQGGRSFLIREVGGAFVSQPPPASPPPVSVFNYDRFEVYVYDGDIGAVAARNAEGWPPPG